MSDDMVKYYRDRAKEYEQIYEWRDPNRQEEQDKMEIELKRVFIGLDVLDIGCGTGYWTQRISETAKSIVGIDVNQAVLDIAGSKKYGCPTEFKVMDAYKIDYPEDTFTGAIASFWLSHVLLEDIDAWIEQMHRVMKPGARVFIADNTFIEGVGGKLQTKPDDLNTYKLRTLNDGSQHLIVKNYLTTEELVETFSRHTGGVNKKNVFMGSCFWWISYTLEK
ncbi:MAG: class I SAM-dependent methyltransferase [Candidatus Bathyarchaeota archaeon]|nr:class I SAM-dependent methyltransferase [Candidatus Bathyarchaeota archaeon]